MYARKRFGQNFLQDQLVIDQIIKQINPSDDQLLIEIGPGQGALTLPLLQKHHRLIAIELDRDLIPLLQKRCQNNKNLTIYQADALHFDFSQLSQQANSLCIIGNLPYNISTPLLFHLLKYKSLIHDMLFMLQLEVVDRITAQVGAANYGRLSIMLQQACYVEKLFDVSPDAFYPKPQVTSAIIRLKPYKTSTIDILDYDLFTKIVRDAFNQRRKNIRNSLKNYLTEQQLQQCHLDPLLRPQQLSISDYAKLSNFLSRI